MAEMSRIHDALGHRKALHKPSSGGLRLGHLGWAPGSRTPRRREGPGLRDYLLAGILIGGLVGVVWWLATSGDQSTTARPAAGNAAVRAEPADASVEPLVVAVETPVASDPPVDASSAPRGESPPDEPSAPTAGDTVAARLDDRPPAPPLSLPVISAILLSEGRRLAIVDGRGLDAGQRVGPWELVSVNRDRVVLRDASGVEQVVTLDHGRTRRGPPVVKVHSGSVAPGPPH